MEEEGEDRVAGGGGQAGASASASAARNASSRLCQGASFDDLKRGAAQLCEALALSSIGPLGRLE